MHFFNYSSQNIVQQKKWNAYKMDIYVNAYILSRLEE